MYGSTFKQIVKRILKLSRTGRTRAIRNTIRAAKLAPVGIATVLAGLVYYNFIDQDEAQQIATELEVNPNEVDQEELRKNRNALIKEVNQDIAKEDNTALYIGGAAIAGALVYYLATKK